MKDELKYLMALAARGRYSRRAFLGKAAAAGITGMVANTMLAKAVRAAGPKKGGTLQMGLGGGESTNSLDPALAASQVPFLYLMTAGDRLTDMSPTGEVMPRMAEKIGSSADAKVWTFTLRKGMTFHDGAPVTADDVVKTMRRHSDENAKSGALGIMGGIESVNANGDDVVFTLKSANADFPALMSDYHLIIQPGGGVDKPDAGIFSGPYKIKSFEPGVRIELEKFADYWDDSRGHYDAIEMLVINDATARNAALQSGQVQLVNQVDPKVADLLKRAPGVTVNATAGRGHYVFIMRCNAAPFDNNDLCMALKLSIDREEMVQKILSGYGSVGNDFPINKAYPLFDASIPQRTYDPEKAADYYKKSGHDGSPIILRTADGAFPGAVDAAALFQQSAAKAGIPLEIKREPNDGYWSDVWNKQPFCASYWGGRPVQDQMYTTAYLSTADWNDTAFKDPHFDELIVQARGELDQAKRKSLYSEAGLLVRDTGGAIVPMFNDFINAYSDKVAGWEDNPNQDTMNGLAGVLCWEA